MEDKPADRIWIRGFFMILLGMLYSVAGTLLLVVAVLQFLCALLGDGPNSRLTAFGRSLGLYIRQIAEFQTFNSDEKPFPFSDWP